MRWKRSDTLSRIFWLDDTKETVMKNIFSPKLYLQGLRKTRTAGIAMSIVIVILNAWIPIQCMLQGVRPGPYDTSPYFTVGSGEFAPFGYLLLFFAPLLVYNMFSYLNERKSSDFFHALPQKRACVYISFMAAIVSWIVFVLFVSTLVNAVLWSMMMYYVVPISAVLLTALGFFILALLSAGFMALAMMLTGSAVSNCLVFLLFFLFVRTGGYFFFYGFSEMTPMFNPAHSWLGIFDIDFFLPISLLIGIVDSEEAFSSAGLLVYWTLVSLGLLTGAGFAYHFRRSESATKSAPNKIMQNIYRIGVTLPFLTLGALLLMIEKDFYLCLLCALVALLVWIIYELMTTKKIKNVVRTLPLLLIPVFLAGVFMASIRIAKDSFYRSTPDRDEIVSVSCSTGGASVNRWIEAVMSETEITEDKIIDQVFAAIAQTKESAGWTWEARMEHGYTHSGTVTLTLRSGRRVTYNLRSAVNLHEVFRSAAQVQAQRFDFVDAHVEHVYVPRLDSSLISNREKGFLLWEAFLEDCEEMSPAQKDDYLRLIEEIPDNAFMFSITGEHGKVRFSQAFLIHSAYTPKTMNLLMQYYGHQQDLEELRDQREELLQLRADEVSYTHMYINSYSYGNRFALEITDFEKVKAFLAYLTVDSHLTDYENADVIYRFQLSVSFAEPSEPSESERALENRATPLQSTTVVEDDEKFNRWIGVDVYLTFSEEDIDRLLQIEQYPINPIS